MIGQNLWILKWFLVTPRPYSPIFFLMSWISKQIHQHELRQLNHPLIPAKTIHLHGKPTPFLYQPIKIKFLFISSSSTLYLRLYEKCHSQQITLNGPLFGWLLLAFHHTFPSVKNNNRYLTPFVVNLPVDMRSRLTQSPLTSQIVGFCVSLCEVKLRRPLPISTGHLQKTVREQQKRR